MCKQCVCRHVEDIKAPLVAPRPCSMVIGDCRHTGPAAVLTDQLSMFKLQSFCHFLFLLFLLVLFSSPVVRILGLHGGYDTFSGHFCVKILYFRCDFLDFLSQQNILTCFPKDLRFQTPHKQKVDKNSVIAICYYSEALEGLHVASEE